MIKDPNSGDLYVGGGFSLPFKGLARWNGNDWLDVGGGTSGAVMALAFDSHGNLYAAGSFNYAGGGYVSNIARWDGQKWYSLVDSFWYGVSGSVYSLAVDSQDRLYVGGNLTQAGRLTVSNLAMWDGAWHSLGNAYFNNSIQALAVDSKDRLYVGGKFSSSPAVNGKGLVMWDGSLWLGLGSGLSTTSQYSSPSVYSVAVGPGDAIYVSGYFDKAGGLNSPNVALWKNGAWSALGAGLPYGVEDIALHPDGSLYAQSPGSMKLYRWDGVQWTDNGATDENWIFTILIPADGAIYIGGMFTVVQGVPAAYLARYQNGAWQAVGYKNTAPDALIYDLAWIGGKLYVAGTFKSVGNVVTQGIAVWTDAGWISVGGGLNNTATCIEPDGHGGFYVGGTFTTAGAISANRVAHWTGSAWQALGSGMNDPSVNDLSLGPDGNLYAVGSFTTAGGYAANRAARWDGTRWYPLGTGLNNYSYVYALAFDPAGNLYVGGTFLGAGTVNAAHIAKWDGAAWTALDSGVNGDVWDVLYSPGDNSIYASGEFTQAGGLATAPVARWSLAEQKWYPTQAADMGRQTYPRLTLDPQNRLVTNNIRNLSDGTSVSDLAWLDGSTWQWMGAKFLTSGVRTRVLFVSPGEFYVGGAFSSVNGMISQYMAHWKRPLPYADKFSLEGQEDTTLALHSLDFTGHFHGQAGLSKVRFDQIPGSGSLLLNGRPVTEGEAIAVADLDGLSFAPTQNYNGTASMTWTGQDVDGNSTPEAQIDLIFTPVNDAPSFVKGTDPSVLEDSGPHSIPGWATQISAGPADEAGQVLTFRLTTDNGSLFADLPAMTPGGDLTFTPAAYSYGSASVTVSLEDDGGLAGGGKNTSLPQTFAIHIAPLIDNAITLSASPNPAGYQQPVALTAHVEGRGPGTPPVPSGMVTFKDGSAVLGSVALAPVIPGSGPVAQAVLTLSNLAAGSHTLTAVYSGDSAYHDLTTSQPVALTITRASATVELNGLLQTYTGRAANLQISTSPAGLPVRILYNGSSEAPVNAGNYPVSAEITDPNYTGSSAGLMVIEKAVLDVQANPVSRVYGVPNSLLTYTLSGFVNGETSSVIHGAPALSTDAVLTSNVGAYAIQVSLGSLSADNYTFHPIASTLTVTQAVTHTAVTVDPKIATYGEMIAFYASVSRESGAQVTPFGSLIFSIDGTPVYTAALDAFGRASFTTTSAIPAGDHTIQAAFVGDANQKGSGGTHGLLVNPASATLTLGSLTAVYDGKPHGAAVVTSPQGLPYTITYNGAASLPINAGSYTIVTTISDPNYTGSAAGTFTLQPAVLDVKANDSTRVYGVRTPLSCTFTGFVNGETAAVLSGSPSLNTSALQFSPPGAYPISITQGTLSAQNYSFTFIDGSLVITKAGTLSTLELSTSSILSGQPVTLAVNILPAAPASGTPKGTVTFLDGITVLDTLQLVDGKAALTTSNFTTGTHVLKVSYSGDGNFHPGSSDTQTLSVVEAADLAVSMIASADDASFSTDLTYTLTIMNQGPDPATQVVLTDNLPEGVIFKSASMDCTHVNGVVTCHLGTLTSGAKSVIQISITIPLDRTGNLINAAQVSGKEADPEDRNNSAELLIPVAPPQRIFLPCIRR